MIQSRHCRISDLNKKLMNETCRNHKENTFLADVFCFSFLPFIKKKNRKILLQEEFISKILSSSKMRVDSIKLVYFLALSLYPSNLEQKYIQGVH